ncbi:hypothetical protein K457DRAFT_152617 [Linnemannia elongata AG-77]|uniref:Cas12f1-like TNB domain-containing protein n=1 Tax=Linnemannia elongata AG-77 TaxID=1314771 RepID=A0A197K8D4_9FUNG|nr:hypothetical protein K457DRAFT_152617 [Linnemannia elongata AG-77]
MVEAHQKYLSAEPLLHEFYGSHILKFANYEHRKAKLSEMDLAVAGVMRLVEAAVSRIPEGKNPTVLFAWGNGTFHSGYNLTSQHMTLQRRLAQKAREKGYLVLLVDEYLTSTMCPTCVAVGVSTRMAKPSMRVCACLKCQRWIHRDVVGAHNIALVGEQYVRTLGRPAPLQRPL